MADISKEVLDELQNQVVDRLSKKQSWFSKLLDADNKQVSSTNLFSILVTIIGILLLVIPVAAIIVELVYSHTVTMSWSDMGSYIGAVAIMFTTVGITKAWTNYSNNKLEEKKYELDNSTNTDYYSDSTL